MGQQILAFAFGQITPSVSFWQSIFALGLLHHFQKQQERQLGYVILIGDAVIAQNVTEAPELLDDVLRRGAGAFNHADFLQSSSLMSPRMTSSRPSNIRFNLVKPPISARNCPSSNTARSATPTWATALPMRSSHLRCGSLHVRRLVIRSIAAFTRSTHGTSGSPRAA